MKTTSSGNSNRTRFAQLVAPRRSHKLALTGLGMVLCSAATAATLSVSVTGIESPLGSVGCSLFSEARGFPMENEKAQVKWITAQLGRVTCRFDDIKPGRYALAIGHDTNGNRRIDSNVFGVPTEQWGVSNNVRPALRAPRFDEAAFDVPGDMSEVTLEIRVKQ